MQRKDANRIYIWLFRGVFAAFFVFAVVSLLQTLYVSATLMALCSLASLLWSLKVEDAE